MSRRVLILDNEEIVLSFLHRTLETAGYEVFQAKTRSEAQQVISSQPNPAEILMVVDVALQGESGVDVAAEIAKKNPGSRILFISGYVDDVLFLNGKAPGGRTAFLQKPFSRVTVIDALEKLATAP